MKLRLPLILTLLAGALGSLCASASTPQKQLWVPELTLQASFTEKARYALFEPEEKPAVALRIEGWRHNPDTLQWSIRDYQGNTRDSGRIPVPAGSQTWEHTLELPPQPAGYFELHMSLQRSRTTLPKAGSRPSGYLSYGMLPAIEKLPLEWVDDSRFGAQGTNFLQTGVFMQGNPFDPLYPALGLVWVYDNYRMAEREGKAPGGFKPLKTEQEVLAKNDYVARTGLCPLVDLHGLPDWLLEWPEGASRNYTNLTNTGQYYAPNNWDTFGDYIKRVASERALVRKTRFTNLRHNYYEIHWEPDWHWKGTDEDFIRMYQVAHKAIHEADPDGILLGPNYGVLKTGNDHLKRLFAMGLGKYMDGIATHTYYIPFGMPEPRGLPEQVRDLVRMTREYLPEGAPIINTEWGVNYHGFAPEQDGVLRREMAEFMRGHLITLGEGIDCTWYFYTADHETGGMMFNLTTPNPVFGATWISPKPVAMAAAASTRLLEATTSVGPVRFLDDKIMAYAFDRDGESLLVLWSPDGESREVRVPVGSQSVTLYDIMGNPQELTPKNGLVRITLNDLPVYLLGAAPELYQTITIADNTLPAILPDTPLTLDIANGAPLVAYKNGEQITLTAQGGAVRLPENMQPGQWLIVQGQGGIAAAQSSVVIELLPQVTITRDEHASGLTLNVQNHGHSAQSGDLLVQRGNDTLFSQPVTNLPTNKTQSVSIPLDALGGSGDSSPLVVSFRAQNGVSYEGPVLHTQFTNAKYTDRRPATDNPTEGWLLEEFTTFDKLDDMRGGAARWKGPSDLMFRIAFRFDAQNLYIALRVRDDSHVQLLDERQCWQQDSVQIGIGALPGPDGWQVSQKLAIALRSDNGETMLFRESQTEGLRTGNLNPDNFSVSVEREGDITHYFIAIPWAEIIPASKGVPEAGRIAVGVFVNDADMEGSAITQRKIMEGFGNGMNFFIPEQFGIVNFPSQQ